MTHSSKSAVVFSIYACALLLGQRAALASPLEVYGFDGRSISMGNAMTASSNDYTAAFYNPGLITSSSGVVAGAGWTSYAPRLGIELERLPQDDHDLPVYPERRSGVTVGGLFLSAPLRPSGGSRWLPTCPLVRCWRVTYTLHPHPNSIATKGERISLF